MAKYRLVKINLKEMSVSSVENSNSPKTEPKMYVQANCRIKFEKYKGYDNNKIVIFISSNAKIANKKISVSYNSIVDVDNSVIKLTRDNIKKFTKSNLRDITKPTVNKIVKMIAVITDELFEIPIVVDFRIEEEKK